MPALTVRAALAALALAAAAAPAAVRGQANPPAVPGQHAADREAVLEVIQRFFDTMTARDSAGAAGTLMDDGGYFRTSGPVRADAPAATFREYLRELARGTSRLVERMWHPEVLVHRDVAMVWTPYDFHVDGRFSHCGVDAFTLVRAVDGWRISSIAYTVERQGCAPSPLGPLEGLVLSYDMATRTADGRIRDWSGHGHHGQASRTEPATGPGGLARLFRTVADRIQVPSSPALDLDGPLTVAAWARVDSLGLHQHLAACDDKWALWITPDDRWRLGDTRGGGWSTPPGAVRAGEWTHVTAVLRGTRGAPLDSGTVTIYLNGRPAPAERHLRTDDARAAGTWNPGPLYATDACYVGFESHQGIASHRTLSFVGAVDELRVYARALTDAEIAALARPPAPRPR